MIISYKTLSNVQFPLYPLPSDNWWEQDGVLFVDNKIVDEKKLPGKTLGIRRIQSRRKNLLPLKKAVFDIPEMLHCNHKVFIDSTGYPFIYEKTYSSKLKCYRIKRIEPKGKASLVWLYGVHHPFTIKRPPIEEVSWARVLHVNGHPWILYDYVETPVKDTYRRI